MLATCTGSPVNRAGVAGGDLADWGRGWRRATFAGADPVLAVEATAVAWSGLYEHNPGTAMRTGGIRLHT